MFVNARHEKRLKEWEQNCRKGLIEKYNPIWVCGDEHYDHPGTVCHPANGGGNVGGNDEGFGLGFFVAWCFGND